MSNQPTSRRRFLTKFSAFLGTIALSRKAQAAILTPRAAEGPYYPQPSMRTPDVDNDLVKISGLVEEAGGEIITLKGKVKDRSGQALAGLRVEIWQCDVDGNYMHPRDSRSVNFDPAFQGFGHDITDQAGRYVFRTIKPTEYPGRTPHIHVKVLQDGQEVLTSQFYIKDHPSNKKDGLFRRMSADQMAAISMEFMVGDNGVETTLDIIV